jgi:hypothetical protein
VKERLALAAVALVAAAVAHPLCNVFFRCGCGWLGPAHCNIHQAAGPHCPWCVGVWRFIAVGAACAVGIFAGSRIARGRGPAAVFAGGMGGFLICALLAGVVTVALTGYPHFILW